MKSQVEELAIALYVAGTGESSSTWREDNLDSCRAFYRRLAKAALAYVAAKAN